MSVKDRLDDAEILWADGRRTGAMLSVLIAVAGTARKRYPRPVSDKESFVRTVFEMILRPVDLRVMFRGESLTYPEILYKFVRCELAHEAGLPVDVRFDPPRGDGAISFSVSATGFVATEDVFARLAQAVRVAPENAADFTPPSAALQ